MAFFNGSQTVTDGLIFCMDFSTDRGYSAEPTDNIIVYPEPTTGWSVSQYLSSEGSASFESDNTGPHMKLSGIVRASGSTDYPRVHHSGDFSTPIDIGTAFSVSFEAKSVDGGDLWFSIYSTGSTKHTFQTGALPTTWTRYTFDNTTNNSFQLTRPYFRFGNDSDAIFVRNIQVEAKDHSTSYTPTARTDTTDVFYDVSGNNYTIDAVDATYTTESMLYFNGTSTRLNINESLPLGTYFSVSSWVKSNSPSGEKTIIGPPANGSDNWFTVNGTSAKVFWTETADTNNDSLSGGTVPTGSWTHVGMIMSASYVEIFVNGSSVASKTDTQSIGSWTSSNIKIGTRSTTGQNYFNGEIGNVSIYNRPLSEAEMNKIYQSQKDRFQ